MNVTFTVDVSRAAWKINCFPGFLKPLAAKLFTDVEKEIQRGIKHLQPVIEERKRQLDAHGDDWADKPVLPLPALSTRYIY